MSSAGQITVTREDAILAAMCAIRHARSVADAETLMEILGIDDMPDSTGATR